MSDDPLAGLDGMPDVANWPFEANGLYGGVHFERELRAGACLVCLAATCRHQPQPDQEMTA